MIRVVTLRTALRSAGLTTADRHPDNIALSKKVATGCNFFVDRKSDPR
jgi:hypothetical protein